MATNDDDTKDDPIQCDWAHAHQLASAFHAWLHRIKEDPNATQLELLSILIATKKAVDQMLDAGDPEMVELVYKIGELADQHEAEEKRQAMDRGATNEDEDEISNVLPLTRKPVIH